MHRTIIAILGALTVAPGCASVSRDAPTAAPVPVEARAETPGGIAPAPPAEAVTYPAGSPYAPEAAYATSGSASGPDVAARPYDPFCAEAVGQAEAASAQALASGSARDARRAERTARFARRDCR